MPQFTSSGFSEIGPALRFLRLHGSATPVKQKEVAARAGVTKGMLSSYERSKQEPSLSTLARLLEALDADLVKLQWALGVVARSPVEAGAGEVESPAGDWRELSEQVAETAPPYGGYRVVRVPEPLGEDEERALGQMLAGFLAYLRYTRSESADERGEKELAAGA